MKIAIATLKSQAPYSQSRAHESEKLPRETSDEYEKRTWRDKSHATSAGNIFIPPMGFKQSLDRAASMLGRQIPGKGKSTYTKFFLSGVLCTEPLILPVLKDTVRGERIHANSDGVRGSGKRVWRTFPVVDEWEGDVSFSVLADEITPDVFEDHLRQAGAFVGIGRFRPQNGGFYGRFTVEKIFWKSV
jgi:hypothetical protein